MEINLLFWKTHNKKINKRGKGGDNFECENQKIIEYKWAWHADFFQSGWSPSGSLTNQ